MPRRVEPRTSRAERATWLAAFHPDRFETGDGLSAGYRDARILG